MKPKTPTTVPRGDPSTSDPAVRKRDRRRQLHDEECARRGVRFLPAQTMRQIYEREGVL